MWCAVFALVTFLFEEVLSEEKRSIYPLLTKHGYSLPGSVIREYSAPSIMECGHKCLRYNNCLSYNFQVENKREENNLCQLNSKAVKDIQDQSELKMAPGFIFIQLVEVEVRVFL